MGLRSASVRHPDVVVMAPALTETSEPHKFKLKQKHNQVKFSLKKYKVYKKNGSLSLSDAKPRLSDPVRPDQAMNGVSPNKTTIKLSPNKTIHSINGLIKGPKEEFISLNKTLKEASSAAENKIIDKNGILQRQSGYGLTSPIGSYIMNDSTDPLEEDNMGLQKDDRGVSVLPDAEGVSPSKEKITQGEVDQLFKNLGVDIPDEISGGADLGQNVEDIFRVFNNMEGTTGSDIAPLGSTPSDSEGIFPGSLTSLFTDDVMMNMCVDENLVNLNKESIIKEKLDEALKKQFQLKRKCDFLMRRLRKLQSRTLGKHVCDEVTGILEYTSNLFDAFNRTKAIGSSESTSVEINCEVRSVTLSTLSLLMRQMEHSSSQQANYIAKNSNKQKYFGAGPSTSNTTTNGMRIPGTIIPSFKPDIKKEIDRVSGELSSQLSLLESEIDSDLTASSSGCDSCDEFVSYSNVHQQTTSIRKRAVWRWSIERATLASRWTWLQGKMADLEYKIRQTNEMRRQLRQAKGVIRLAAKQNQASSSPTNQNSSESNSNSSQTPNGFLDEVGGCARTVGVTGWRKRRVVHVEGLHLVSKRALRQSSIKCSCRGDRPPCMICTGRTDPTAPSHTIDMQPVNQRLAFFDSAFHPQLSFQTDVSQSIHYSALMKHSEWQMRAGRVVSARGRIPRHATDSCVIGPNAAREAVNAVVHSSSIRRDTQPPSPALMETTEPKRCKVLPPTPSPSPGPHLSDLPTITASLPPIGFRKKNPRGRRRKTPLETFRVKSMKKTPFTISEMDSCGAGSSSRAGNSLVPLEADGSEVRLSTTGAVFNGNDPAKRKRENSYDIDNIVIPYCMAASTRPEKLNYKEILTPKWRLVRDEVTSAEMSEVKDLKNGVRRASHDFDGEEDASEETAIARHDRCEIDERKKFLSYLKIGRSRGGRRVDSRAESSGPNTPDQALSPMELDPPSPVPLVEVVPPPPLPPQPQPLAPPAPGPLTRKRTVSLSSQPISPTYSTLEVAPYEPRIFPLSEDVFNSMVQEQKDFQEYPVDEAIVYKNCESTNSGTTTMVTPPSPSTDSIDSALNTEDPNDPEWTSKNKA